ncbi:hypothetical protein VTL71DRAFT_10441 [Oculimacula yallundae]|uniref:Uncharacterized protein n=1 Tax=Oculimacula yallundae TaxID=86028 RepID=A0ABR4CTJ1_9HELO
MLAMASLTKNQSQRNSRYLQRAKRWCRIIVNEVLVMATTALDLHTQTRLRKSKMEQNALHTNTSPFMSSMTQVMVEPRLKLSIAIPGAILSSKIP